MSPLSRKVLTRFADSRIDLLLAFLAAAFSWVSLTYPFGRDQGLYYYVGREWALRGSIPYRDVFDHKTPGIYLVHALCVTIFGETLYGIRIAELMAVVALGWIGGAIVANARALTHAPLRGVGSIAASVLFFGFLDFKATSEAEVWIALMILASIALSQRRASDQNGRSRAALVASGAVAGAALVMKPTAALLIVVVIGMMLWQGRRTPRQLAAAQAMFGAGALAVLGTVFIYLLSHSALRPFYDIVVEANRLYVKDGSLGTQPSAVLEQTYRFFDWYKPISHVLVVLLVLAIARAILRKDRASLAAHAISLSLCATAWASVVAQGKFYQGHWGVMIAGTTLVVVSLVADAVKLLPARLSARVSLGACLLFAALFAVTGERVSEYWKLNRAAVGWLGGTTRRDEFIENFSEQFGGGPALDNERCGTWLREHSKDSDTIAVRGFQPQIYALAHRRYPGRLFWTVFARGPGGAAHGEEWLAEDRRLLAANPPRYAVTLSFVADGSDGSAWWTARGYTERVKIGDFTILEHTPETAMESW